MDKESLNTMDKESLNTMDAVDGLIKIGKKKVSFKKIPITNIKYYDVKKMRPYNYIFKNKKDNRLLLIYAKSELEFLKNKCK